MVGREGFEPPKPQGRLVYSQMRLTASRTDPLSFIIDKYNIVSKGYQGYKILAAGDKMILEIEKFI